MLVPVNKVLIVELMGLELVLPGEGATQRHGQVSYNNFRVRVAGQAQGLHSYIYNCTFFSGQLYFYKVSVLLSKILHAAYQYSVWYTQKGFCI